MAITSKEIAELCGVSRGTVDRALNGKDRISPKTRDRILAVAKEMGYHKDMLARGLVKGKTMYIGVVVFDIRNHYFSQLVNAIELEAGTKNYFINIALHEKDKDKEYQLINSLVAHRVDGLLVCPVNKGKEFEKFLLNLQIPTVIIGNYVSNKLPYIGIDEKQAAIDAVNLLASKGYETIIFVCPPLADREKENIYAHEQRTYGFIDATRQQNLEGIIISTWDYLHELDTILKCHKTKIAVLCSGDIYALQVMQHLRVQSVQIPSEVGIMGFDNIDMLEFINPALTTISNSIEQVGRTAVNMLIEKMNEKSVNMVTLVPHEIIDRDSA